MYLLPVTLIIMDTKMLENVIYCLKSGKNCSKLEWEDGDKMSAIRTRYIQEDEERQYMIQEDYEIYEKRGAPMGACTLHYHDFYEVIYILDGEFSSLVDNVTYFLKKGDFLLINRNVMHKYHYVEGKHVRSRRIILWITKQMLDRLSDGEQDLSRCFEERREIVYHFPASQEAVLRECLVHAAMEDVPELEGMKGKKLFDRAKLLLFFVYLSELVGKKAFAAGEEMQIRHELAEWVNAYIEEHMTERISLDALAEHVHMSKYHFLRKFKELTGMTVHSYLNHKRLIHGCKLLREGEAVGTVWEKCGFADYSSFLRNFKKEYGIPPTGYIKYFGGQGDEL